MRPFSQLLRKHGPEIGLFFGKRAKNYCYVAKADPGFAHESLVNSRGVAGAAKEDWVAAEVEARRALQGVQNSGDAVGGDVQVGFDGQMASEEAAGPAFAPPHLRTRMTKPRRLVSCQSPYTRGRSVILPLRHRHRRPIASRPVWASVGKCAASFLCAVPMVRIFSVSEEFFTRSLQRYNGIVPVQTLHTQHCGARGEMVLAASDWVHLKTALAWVGTFVRKMLCVIPLPMQSTNAGWPRWSHTRRCPWMSQGVNGRRAPSLWAMRSGEVYVIGVSIANTDSATSQRRRGDFGAVEGMRI